MKFGSAGTNSLIQLNEDIEIPDLMFGYNYNSLYTLLENFGKQGRSNYLDFQFYDYVYPLIYSSLLLGIFIRLNSIKTINFWIYLPWIGAIADYFENILLRDIIISFPKMDDNLVQISSVFTIAKWLLAYITIGLIIILILKKLYLKFLK